MSEVAKTAKKSEDKYFAKLEFERKQKKLEEEQNQLKAREREELKKKHWMHCPKCGMEMVELTFEGVQIDKCSHCLGIYLDDGELNQLLEAKPGMIGRFAKLFK